MRGARGRDHGGVGGVCFRGVLWGVKTSRRVSGASFAALARRSALARHTNFFLEV